jgi:hypothetical protein
MKPWWSVERLCWTACLVLTALGSPAATALSSSPPAAIALQFEARTDRLTHEGLLAVDKLAVRAGQCPAKALAVHVLPAHRVDPALTQRRISAVQRRLDRLGLKLTVAMKSLRNEDAVAPRHRGMLLADVGADDDVWCSLRAGSQAFTWADELGRHVEGAEPRLPAFWQRLSEQGRLSLALPLATAALCADASDCKRHLELYHWLAEKTLPTVSSEGRRWWLLNLWAQAEDADVERFWRRWALVPLTVEERAGHAHELAGGGLPWAVIEQRLLQPGVMARFGEQPMILGGPGPHWLLHAASRRGQLEAFDRLIDVAGPAKACFTEMALWGAGGDQEQFDAWKPHFARWAQGALTPHQAQGSPVSCNPVALVAREAFCGPMPDDVSARFEAIWDVLQQAGVTFDTPAVRQLIAPGDGRQPCKLEPVPGSTTRLRRVAQP